MKKRITLGIMAHVDAGKTTLTEALLYQAGVLRKQGRVDNKDTFLDTDIKEKERGITIFSKQAILTCEDMEISLLDTPGHTDFCAEAESVLPILDCCILIISAADGVTGHTLNLWNDLERYKIPVIIFVNKMDQPGMDKNLIMAELHKNLSHSTVDMTGIYEKNTDEIKENISLCDEKLLGTFLEEGSFDLFKEVKPLMANRALFPVFFGSALKADKIDILLKALHDLTPDISYSDNFGARVYKITRDNKNNRLTHLKVTGGSLKSKEILNDEKINEIRLYSGNRYETVTEVYAGTVCAVTGLNDSKPGDGYGELSYEAPAFTEPVLCYKVYATDNTDISVLLKYLMTLSDEDPQLNVTYEEEHKEILVNIMGEVQAEILERTLKDRFGCSIAFTDSSVVYKETIEDTVEGVGHFEPLRHYAEVHLILSPLPNGKGLIFDTDCSEDILDKHWQSLILTHLREKVHKGVLTGSPITDMRVTLVAGRAHTKHTEGGDFRQATYRAVRQGLMQAKSRLLEPFNFFRMDIPRECVGRAMNDVENMAGFTNPPEIIEERAILTGRAPVSCMRNYGKEIAAYTKGTGSLSTSFAGYDRCHNEEEVIASKNYDPTADVRNSPDSVFCKNGSGVNIPWNEVKDYMHVEAVLKDSSKPSDDTVIHKPSPVSTSLGTDEIDAILNKTFYANSNHNINSEAERRKGIGTPRITREKSADKYEDYSYNPATKKPACLVVDGYNIIHAWSELKELAAQNLDSARDRLTDILCNYKGAVDFDVIVVFDAYKVKGRSSSSEKNINITVVYTGENETADQYIERFSNDYGKKYDVTVATSDRLEQTIVWGNNCRRISAKEFEETVKRTLSDLIKDHCE
ncbi:MAG: NYN domain-containing protein [Lachnospiraceae bacterium]|nr:NYN domain-containing protein [Lachnospiraceae bacterium]